MKKFVPTFLAKSIYEIDLSFFKDYKIKYLLLDLDNTLDSPHTMLPSFNCVELIKQIKDNGLIPIIISNNSKKRVKKYADVLNIDYVWRTLKPFSFKIKKYLKIKNIDLDSVIIIGDQVFTDIQCANNLKAKSILTERLTNKDQIITFFNRKIDIHYRNRIKKEKLSINWREAKYANSKKS